MLERSRNVVPSLEFLGQEHMVDPRVERTIIRMEEQLHTEISVADLARAVGLSLSQLTRLFRAGTGQTPGAYLRRVRMDRARILIERSSLSIGEVMAQVGINDPSHFARDFRRTFGVGPRELRQQQRGSGAHGSYVGFTDPQ